MKVKPAAVPTAASNAVGSSGEGLFIVAGAVVAVAGWKRNQHVGEWWWRVVIGSAGLAILASMTNRTKAAPIVKGLAWLTFLSACIYAIPVIQGTKLPPYKGSSPHGTPNPGGSPTEGAPRGGSAPSTSKPGKGGQRPV